LELYSCQQASMHVRISARYELRLSVVGCLRGVSVFLSTYFGVVVYSFLDEFWFKVNERYRRPDMFVLLLEIRTE